MLHGKLVQAVLSVAALAALVFIGVGCAAPTAPTEEKDARGSSYVMPKCHGNGICDKAGNPNQGPRQESDLPHANETPDESVTPASAQGSEGEGASDTWGDIGQGRTDDGNGASDDNAGGDSDGMDDRGGDDSGGGGDEGVDI